MIMTFYILCDCGDLWGLGTPEGETGRTALHGTQARNCKGWASLWLLRTGAAGQACDRQAQDSLLPPAMAGLCSTLTVSSRVTLCSLP